MRYFKMLLLCSAILFCIGQVVGYNIDTKLAHNDIEKLKKYLNSQDKSDTDQIDQKFAKLLDAFKGEEEKKILLSQIVPIYLKMFKSVKVAEVQDSIINLSQMLHQSYEDFLKPIDHKVKLLTELHESQVSDVKFQRSAMKELLRFLKDIHDLQHPRNPTTPKCKRESRRKRRGC